MYNSTTHKHTFYLNLTRNLGIHYIYKIYIILLDGILPAHTHSDDKTLTPQQTFYTTASITEYKKYLNLYPILMIVFESKMEKKTTSHIYVSGQWRTIYLNLHAIYM